MGTSGGSVETWLQVFGQGAGSNATVPLPQLAGSTRSGSDVFTQAESLLRQIRAEEDGMEPSPLTGSDSPELPAGRPSKEASSCGLVTEHCGYRPASTSNSWGSLSSGLSSMPLSKWEQLKQRAQQRSLAQSQSAAAAAGAATTPRAGLTPRAQLQPQVQSLTPAKLTQHAQSPVPARQIHTTASHDLFKAAQHAKHPYRGGKNRAPRTSSKPALEDLVAHAAARAARQAGLPDVEQGASSAALSQAAATATQYLARSLHRQEAALDAKRAQQRAQTSRPDVFTRPLLPPPEPAQLPSWRTAKGHATPSEPGSHLRTAKDSAAESRHRLHSCFSQWRGQQLQLHLQRIELLSSFQWRRKLHVWQAWQHFTITGRQQRQAEAVARQQRLNDIAITFHLMYRAHSALLAWHRAVRAARDTAKREREAVLERQADARKQHAAEQFQRLYAQHACFAAWRKEVDRERAAHELQAEHAIRQDRIQRFVQHTLARKAAAAAQPAAESHKPSGVPVDAEAACSGGPNGIQEPQLGAPCRQSPQPEQQSQDDSRRVHQQASEQAHSSKEAVVASTLISPDDQHTHCDSPGDHNQQASPAASRHDLAEDAWKPASSAGGRLSAEPAKHGDSAAGPASGQPSSLSSEMGTAPGSRGGAAEPSPHKAKLASRHTPAALAARQQLRHQRFEAIKAKREEARRQKEEAEIAAIEEMQRAERIRQLEAKKKRLQQEAARDLRRQLAARQAEMAALHYANELAVRWGLRPWQQLVAHRRQQTLQATQFAARCSLIRCIAAWIDYISEAREAAAEALCQAELRADQQRRRVLSWRAMWALQLAVQWRQLAERDAAAAWFRTCAGQALAAWRQYTVLQSNARLLAALQTEQAADHHARMAGQRAAFRGWAQALHAACEEAAALARREQARQKINGWLDEYRRNKRAVAAESGNEDGGGAGLVQDLLAESSWASALQEPADLEPGAATLSSPTSPLLAGFKGAGHRSFGTNMQRPEDTSVENMAKDGNMASPGYNAKPAGRRSFGWLGGAVLSDIRNSAQFNDID